MKKSALFRNSLMLIMLFLVGTAVHAQEPYAALSDNNTVLTFYYDDQKEERNGMSVGPFSGSPSWYGQGERITSVVFDDSFANCTTLTSTAYWFYYLSKLSSITGISNLKTDNVTDMRYMFHWCYSLTSLDVTGFKTDNVTDMRKMFSGCSGLTSLDVTGFKTDNVTNMANIFSSCSGLKSLDVSGFKTQNVTNMESMFYGCSGLKSLDVTGFKTDNVTNMNDMFYDCSGLTSLDVSGFNTQNVTYMSSMFEGCSGLTSLDVTGFNTQNVTNMGGMFKGCSGLTSLDVTGFKTYKVKNMNGMFQNCSGLTTIYAGYDWSTAAVTSGNYMFIDCTNLKGGAGTIFDANHTDYTYARIDGGPNSKTPGYLTLFSSYGLTVAGVRVTSLNASAITGDNITGTVTFNIDSRTLRMDGATINGCIYSYGDLAIDLKGENTIMATDTCAIKNTDPTAMHNLTFKSTDGTGSLTLNPWSYSIYQGFNEPSFEDYLGVVLGDLSGGGTVLIGDTSEKYDLWVGNTQVTDNNKTDILRDGSADQGKAASFQYIPSLNKLFITNNTDNLTIETTNDEGLTIYLAPNSTNTVGNIIYTGNNYAPLTVTTDGNYPGTISLSANINVISGFSSLTLEQNLVIMSPEDIAYDAGNRRLETTNATIGAPLAPITEEKTITPKGDELQPESGNDDINKVVNDILYTLGNANDSNGDGYDDGGFIVINSVTTDQQAVRVTQNYTPGTNEYLEGFKGLTFMIPAGKGKIAFNVQTSDGYAMKVMVGDAAPVIVESTEKGTVEIPYNVAEPTYVYAYNAGAIGDANSARSVQKGKMTTVHIKIYGTTVKPNKIKSANSAAEASGGEYQGEIIGLEGQGIETDEEIEACKGDVNGDETVDIADIVEIMYAIMGKHSTTFDKRAADGNGDGVFNTADIVIIAKKILK